MNCLNCQSISNYLQMLWICTLYVFCTVLFITDSKVLRQTPADNDPSTFMGTRRPDRPTPMSVFGTPKCLNDCPLLTRSCRCIKCPDTTIVVCCDIKELKSSLECDATGDLNNVTEIHIRNATFEELDVTTLNLKILKTVCITNGQINKVVGTFFEDTPIQFLNLSNNAITSIEERAVEQLTNLSILDISHNNLTKLPDFKVGVRIGIDISGNNEMECQTFLRAKNKSELYFENVNKTFCVSRKTFHWFNSTFLFPITQLEDSYGAPKICCVNCTCEPYRLDMLPGKLPTSSVMVDCSGKQLTDIPLEVPVHTIVLNISNNNITTLRRLQNPNFNNIRELYADNNQITSITELEGTQFFDNFVALSLRNNKLITIPMYIFTNIFDRNQYMNHLALGLNKLTCDCKSAKYLKIWLLTKEKYIKDYKEIMCENYPDKVIDLDVTQLCTHHTHEGPKWNNIVYYIIGIEVLLLICLFLKVSYDYWVFKTLGYLPWPASKMPRLPCDWLCE